MLTDQGKIYGIYRQSEIKQRKNDDGYAVVTLGKNQFRTVFFIHRLVAEHFIPNPDAKPEVNHLNFDRADARVDNLVWMTHEDNIAYSYEYNLDNMLHARDGAKNGRSKLSEEDVIYIRNLHKNGSTVSELAKKFECGWSTIDHLVKRETWTHI